MLNKKVMTVTSSEGRGDRFADESDSGLDFEDDRFMAAVEDDV